MRHTSWDNNNLYMSRTKGPPWYRDSGGCDPRDEADELARVIEAEWQERRVRGLPRPEPLETELRAVLQELIELEPMGGKRDASYVEHAVAELRGRPGPAWSTRIDALRAEVATLRQARAEQLQELRHRLERSYWANITLDDKARIRDHFRGIQSHPKLLKKHQAAAQEHAEAAVHPLSRASVARVREQVDALASHRHARGGERCPDCGSCLVGRTRARDGGTFVGCSGFPACAYAWGVELGPTRGGESIDPVGSGPDDALKALAAALARHFDTGDAAEMCRTAGLDPARPMPIGPGSTADEAWAVLLAEARSQGRSDALKAHIVQDLRLCMSTPAGALAVGRIDSLWTAWLASPAGPGPAAAIVPGVDRETIAAACTQGPPVGTTAEEEVKTMGETSNKPAAPGPTGIGGVASMVLEFAKDDMGDAAWRTAADEIVETLKAPAKIALRKAQRTAVGRPVAAFALKAIDHPLGEGVFSLACGMTLVAYGPLRGKTLGPKTLRVSKELRVKGWKPFTDLFAKTIIAPVRDTVVKLIENLPDEQA